MCTLECDGIPIKSEEDRLSLAGWSGPPHSIPVIFANINILHWCSSTFVIIDEPILTHYF